MTSYEFEKAAKHAVVDYYRVRFGDNITIADLDLVWFAHELGNKKCTIWGPSMGSMYAEVTYSKNNHEMYVNIYSKVYAGVISEDDLVFDGV